MGFITIRLTTIWEFKVFGSVFPRHRGLSQQIQASTWSTEVTWDNDDEDFE